MIVFVECGLCPPYSVNNRFDTSIEYNVITTKKQNNEYINLLFASWLTFVT